MSVHTKAITAERLTCWSKHLEQEHATPIALFAVGHDHASGQLVVCTLDESQMTKDALRGILRAALELLR